jgi:CRISPR-associated protein Csx14
VKPSPDIILNVDTRNPGQFFACCGLLEISSRIWRDSEAWFEVTGRRSTYRIATNSGHDDALAEIVRKVSEPDTVIEIDTEYYAAGLRPLLLLPFELQLDWWIEDGVNEKSPLKMWAGQQTPRGIMTNMQAELRDVKEGQKLFSHQRLMSGRWGIDAASSWTARGLGYSPDEQNMPWTAFPATEVFAAIGLQRCRPLRIDEMKGRWFSYHIWTCPLGISVVPAAAVMGKGQIAERYLFQAKMRSKQYGCFDWGRSWTGEQAEADDEVGPEWHSTAAGRRHQREGENAR